MIEPGQLVDNYRVVRLLGRGGMGMVYEAVHQEIGRRAAIKVLYPQSSQDPQFVTRFLNEARAVNRVRHPGLVEVFEFGRLPDGTPYIIMEYLDGESLAALLQREGGRLARATALAVAGQIAAALASAHDKGIVHRDLKPDNVMLVPDSEWPGHERVKILDFGIAKLTEPEAAEPLARTRPGAVMGTPEYMAPEQCMGAERVDGQADVYSLGVMLYQMLAGKRPFEAKLAIDLMSMHVRAMPPQLRLRVPDIDEPTATLVEAMLAKPAAERPSMHQVVEALGRIIPIYRPAQQLAIPTPGAAAASGAAPTAAGSPSLLYSYTLPGSAPADPFIAGPPVAHPRQFFGRERELKRLFNLWRRPPLQNAAVIGKARSGKTSLLYYLKNILTTASLRPGQRADWLPDPRRYRFVFVDFQDPRVGTQEGLLRHLLRGLDFPVPARCDLEQFMGVVASLLRTPTLILLDEVGVALQRYKELHTTFWEGLRALATNQVEGNLGFVLSCSQPPHELAQQHHGGSPFFNIFGYSATLGPLTEAEARALIGSSPLPFAEPDIQWLLARSGRWPILLQILCRERLLALQEEDKSDLWQEEALRQMTPFLHLLKE